MLNKIFSIFILTAVLGGFASAQVATKADTVKVISTLIEDSTASASWPNLAPGGKMHIVNKGVNGIYAITSTGWVRLDSAGTSFGIDSDTTINVFLSGITYTIKVDSTVMETIYNSTLRAKNGISVVYSATGPDSVGADTSYLATKYDLDAIVGLYGPGTDGAIAPTADTTLTRDMYASSLTLGSGIDLYPAGYRIFVRGTLTLGAGSTINDTGKAGANGGNGTNVTTNSTNGGVGTAGGATAGKADAYLHRQNSDATFGGNGGQAGGATPSSPGVTGNNGTSKAQCTARNNAGAGGVGGANSGNPQPGGAAGNGGTRTAPTGAYGKFEDFVAAFANRGMAVVTTAGNSITGACPEVSVGGGGGGSGSGGSSTGTSSGGNISYGGPGAGGSGGAGGGLVWIAAHTISGTGTITVKGGKGGNGGNGGTCSGGVSFNGGGNGGAGGGGGTGGAIFLFYHSLANTVVMDTTGGVAGTKGTGGTATGTGAVNGNDGNNGNTGGNGFTLQFKFN